MHKNKFLWLLHKSKLINIKNIQFINCHCILDNSVYPDGNRHFQLALPSNLNEQADYYLWSLSILTIVCTTLITNGLLTFQKLRFLPWSLTYYNSMVSFLSTNIDKKTTVYEFIKHIKNYNRHLNEIDKTKIHTLIISLFHLLLYTKASRNRVNKALYIYGNIGAVKRTPTGFLLE